MSSYTSTEKAVRKTAAMGGGHECTPWHPVTPESKQPKGVGLEAGVWVGGKNESESETLPAWRPGKVPWG